MSQMFDMNTKEKIINSVQETDLIQKISFGELQAWALQFPYVTTFKIWVAEKAVLINHPAQEDFIEQAALISQNRHYLQQKIENRRLQWEMSQNPIPSAVIDESSETRTESILEIPKIEEEVEENELFHAIVQDTSRLQDLEFEATDEEKIDEIIDLPNIDSFENFYNKLDTITDIVPLPEKEPVEIESLDLTGALDVEDEYGFGPGDEDFEGENHELFEDIYESEAEDDSILDLYEAPAPSESGNVISETLAKILEKQGHIEKAEKMYKQLRLLFPEKDAYFAEILQKLNQKKND